MPRVSLEMLLLQLEPLAAKYSVARTPLEREQLRQAARDQAVALLKNRMMILQATVTDVRSPVDGQGTVAFKDLDLGSYASRRVKELRLRIPGKVSVRIKPEEVGLLKAGQTIWMAGLPVFRPSQGTRLYDSAATADAILGIGFSSDGAQTELGTLSLDRFQWEIGVVQAAPGPTAPRTSGRAR